MKKLFTLVALLAVFLGAKAEWVEDYKIDYSTSSGFPFYVMGYVPEWVDGVMTDYGAAYSYKTDADMEKEGALGEGDEEVGTVKTGEGVVYHKIKLASAAWHQYFIADGIVTELDGAYTVKAMVKASEPCQINVNMGWGWDAGQSASASVSIGTEWQEVTWEYTGIGGTKCNLVAQPGSSTATIEWKYLTVSHNQKAQRPVEWLNQLTNGDDCAQMINKSLEQEKEVIDPAGTYALVKKAPVQTIDGEKVYVVNAPGVNVDDYKDQKKTNGDDITNNYAWANQFFIVSPVPFKAGEIVKVEFDYKADKEANTQTQAHGKPTYYQWYSLLGDVKFTSEWQHFSKEVTIDSNQAGEEGMYSIAFNLNPDQKEDNVFYFKKLSVSIMKLDRGYFVAGSNPDGGIEYDYDNAVEFKEEQAGKGVYTATIGEKNAYVSQVMISTVRGNDAAFKGATLKPASVTLGEWVDYSVAGLAKLNLPGVGIWKITIREANGKMKIEFVEGTLKEKPVINPNPTVVVVKGKERDDLADGKDQDGNVVINEEEGGTGQAWDNQFFIVANRALTANEVTVVKFKYKASKEAKTTTQTHEKPGNYVHWGAIDAVNFTTEWQDFEKTFTVPTQCDGSDNPGGYKNNCQSIAFNMAEIKAACDYEIKDVVWMLEDGSESLIDQTGSKNFFVKEGAGSTPYQFGTDPNQTGINNVVVKKNNSNVKFNLAGQRVSNDYKGMVVDGNGNKYLAK